MQKTEFNFFDYLSWRGDLSFENSPFNEVDGLILCAVVYLNFDGILADSFQNKKTFEEVSNEFVNLSDYNERSFLGAMINKDTARLLQVCALTKRFSQIKVCGYREIFDKEKEEQFAGLTFILDDKKQTRVVVFRGTDDSLTGWKEDFNLAYKPVIPSQLHALEYLENAYKSLYGEFIVAGHSKGGNIAVYSAMNSKRWFFGDIKNVYNYDGPGFSVDVICSKEFNSIKDKILTFYPSFCIIGSLFYHDDTFTIVSSTNNTFMQHDPFSWKIEQNTFVKAQAFAKQSVVISDVSNKWINQVPVEEKEKFINTFFGVVKATGEICINGLVKNLVSTGTKVVSAMAKLPADQRKQFTNMFNLFKKFMLEGLPVLHKKNT